MATDSPFPELKKTHTMARQGRPWRDRKPPPSAPVWAVIQGFGAYWALVGNHHARELFTLPITRAAIDTLDAFPEKHCAERAAALTADRPAESTVWYIGHWGFQYYCERAA